MRIQPKQYKEVYDFFVKNCTFKKQVKSKYGMRPYIEGVGEIIIDIDAEIISEKEIKKIKDILIAGEDTNGKLSEKESTDSESNS